MGDYKKEDPVTKTDFRTLVLTTTVSLFIALMAFFITLGSYSSQSPKKLETARNSLNSAFGFVEGGISHVAYEQNMQADISKFEDDASAQLRTVMPDLKFQSRKTAIGKVLTVEVPRADFEERWAGLRTRMGDLMVNRSKGKQYDLQMLALNGRDSAAALVTYAGELSDEGVDGDKLSIGYDDAGRDAIELRFVLKGSE